MNTDAYKKQLQEEYETLTKELSTIGTHNQANTDWEATPESGDVVGSADSNTTADRFEDFEERSALMTPLEGRFNQVKDALKKIEDGTFGICRICKAPIEQNRLEANPAAETCITHREL